MRRIKEGIEFAEVFPDRSIVHSLSGQLSWSHFRNIIYIEDPLAREFYTEMCRHEMYLISQALCSCPARLSDTPLPEIPVGEKL